MVLKLKIIEQELQFEEYLKQRDELEKDKRYPQGFKGKRVQFE